jgi:hypothetical protein
MNKLKATKKEMQKYNYKILGVGYCEMQHLLNYKIPVAYSCGTYGWSCDYYNIEGIIISTGYSPIITKNMNFDYNLIKEYDKRARELNNADEVNNLLIELLNKLEVKN